MRWSRAIRTLVVFALLGAVATIATSYALHALARYRMSYNHAPPRWHAMGRTLMDSERPLTVSLRHGRWPLVRRTPPGFAWADQDSAPLRDRIVWESLGWRAAYDGIEVGEPRTSRVLWSREGMLWVQSGWPLPALAHGTYAGVFVDGAGTRTDVISPSASLAGGLTVQPWRPIVPSHAQRYYATVNPIHRVALPLLPLWPGFLVNTVFYALLLYAGARLGRLALGMLPAVRRRRRRRLGRCAACGYDRGGLDAEAACPECGAVADARKASAPAAAT